MIAARHQLRGAVVWSRKRNATGTKPGNGSGTSSSQPPSPVSSPSTIAVDTAAAAAAAAAASASGAAAKCESRPVFAAVGPDGPVFDGTAFDLHRKRPTTLGRRRWNKPKQLHGRRRRLAEATTSSTAADEPLRRRRPLDSSAMVILRKIGRRNTTRRRRRDDNNSGKTPQKVDRRRHGQRSKTAEDNTINRFHFFFRITSDVDDNGYNRK